MTWQVTAQTPEFNLAGQSVTPALERHTPGKRRHPPQAPPWEGRAASRRHPGMVSGVTVCQPDSLCPSPISRYPNSSHWHLSHQCDWGQAPCRHWGTELALADRVERPRQAEWLPQAHSHWVADGGSKPTGHSQEGICRGRSPARLGGKGPLVPLGMQADHRGGLL